MEGRVLFIVDGCNGPIRLDREMFRQKNGDQSQSISFLQVVNGENRGTRLALLVTLDRFLASRPNWHADIYFDGLGVDVHSTWELAGKEWNWTSSIRVKVTPLREEADNLIVQQIQSNNPLLDYGTTRQTMTLNEALQSLNDFSSPSQLPTNQVWVFQRNSSGPGRSRQILKRLGGLMRPESYFCLFGLCSNGYTRNIKSLRSFRHLLVDTVVHYSNLSSSTTTTSIVATDDIFLRQRIVETGGLVMTFEQLWDMLVPYSS